MKKWLIVSLLCVNVVLAGALVAANMTQAYGQAKATYLPTTDYTVATGDIEEGSGAIYIIDGATQKLSAVVVRDADGKNISIAQPRDLTRDFPQR